jgi:hypothetical protein
MPKSCFRQLVVVKKITSHFTFRHYSRGILLDFTKIIEQRFLFALCNILPFHLLQKQNRNTKISIFTL